jgi:hypothetical protein
MNTKSSVLDITKLVLFAYIVSAYFIDHIRMLPFLNNPCFYSILIMLAGLAVMSNEMVLAILIIVSVLVMTMSFRKDKIAKEGMQVAMKNQIKAMAKGTKCNEDYVAKLHPANVVEAGTKREADMEKAQSQQQDAAPGPMTLEQARAIAASNGFGVEEISIIRDEADLLDLTAPAMVGSSNQDLYSIASCGANEPVLDLSDHISTKQLIAAQTNVVSDKNSEYYQKDMSNYINMQGVYVR